MSFCKLWFKIVWKLRSVYCSLVVHLFDVLTDILVIISWLSYPDIEGDHIDPKVMAYSALAVLAIHKLVSFIAFWTKERKLSRCVLQVLDLLIFEEIFLSHKKVVTNSGFDQIRIIMKKQTKKQSVQPQHSNLLEI